SSRAIDPLSRRILRWPLGHVEPAVVTDLRAEREIRMSEESDLHAELAERMAATAFYPWIGFTIVSARKGEVEIAMEAEPHHLNVQGLVHGGVIATMLDSAAGMS